MDSPAIEIFTVNMGVIGRKNTDRPKNYASEFF